MDCLHCLYETTAVSVCMRYSPLEREREREREREEEDEINVDNAGRGHSAKAQLQGGRKQV